MKDLTLRQQEILGFIQLHNREQGYWPSIRDIQTHFKFASTNAVMGHLRALERKGAISRVAGQARAFRVTHDPESAAPPHAFDVVDIPVYGNIAATPTLLSETVIPPGGTCAGKPCWKSLGKPAGAKGFKYTNKTVLPGGVSGLLLTPGAAGKAKITLTGKGAALALPAIPPTFPLRVQLLGAGNCWESSYAAADATKNLATQLKAKGPPAP